MTRDEINKILLELNKYNDRNIVIVDFGNVEKWKESLGWKIGIRELGNLVKHLSSGKKYLRRFYYGSDYGKNEKTPIVTMWSAMILNKARMNNFKVITKNVKYIKDKNHRGGFVKKCDLDVEMAVDLIKKKDNYDAIVLFSGNSDLAYALRYLNQKYGKFAYVFAARNYLGKELLDCKINGIIKEILFAEDFEYRLDKDRFKI